MWPHLEVHGPHYPCLLQPSRIPRESEHYLLGSQVILDEGSGNLFYKGPTSKYLGLADIKVSVATTLGCCCNMEMVIDKDVNK